MLDSYKMVSRNGLLYYPEEAKEAFLATGGLNFQFSDPVSAEEIWEFMTVEAPRRFPNAFVDNSNVYLMRPSPYLEFLWTIKYRYCMLTLKDRIDRARAKGIPVVFVQGGQNQEPYYAANTIAARPYVSIILRGMAEGLSYKERTRRDKELIEEGRKILSPEGCHGMIAGFSYITGGISPTDLIAPYLVLRCSDIAYTAEAHRSTQRKTPTFLVDFPVNYEPGKDWQIEYLAENIRRLVKKLTEVGGSNVTDEDLRAQIKQLNYARQLGAYFAEAWMKAKYIPSYGFDYFMLISLPNDLLGDPLASIDILELAKKEITERVENGIKGAEIAGDAVRLFVCGSCYTVNAYRIEKAGGATVGFDDQYNRLLFDVEEEGDPYWNLAKATLSFPYERATEVRAQWVAEQCRKARCDGLIFAYNWGCQYQSAVARMIGEIVKKEAGIPSLEVEVDTLTQFEELEQSENRNEAFVEMLRTLRD